MDGRTDDVTGRVAKEVKNVGKKLILDSPCTDRITESTTFTFISVSAAMSPRVHPHHHLVVAIAVGCQQHSK